MAGLGAEKQDLRQSIDDVAGQVRSRYMTIAPGQDYVYVRKLAQSVDYIAAHKIDPNAPVPVFVAVEAARIAKAASVAAKNMADAADVMDTRISEIENIRINGRASVTAAANKQDAQAAADDAIAALWAYRG